MLALDTAVAGAHTCATADPVLNAGTWSNRRTGRVATYHYLDRGDYIKYNKPVPRLVEMLVEERTGTRIRIACR